MHKEDFEDFGLAITATVSAVLIFVLVAVAVMLVYTGVIRPALLDLEREGNQRSQQFVDTTISRLFQLNRKYEDLGADIKRLAPSEDNTQVVEGMRSRQESLLDEMEREAASIPDEEIPSKIKELLQEKGYLQ